MLAHLRPALVIFVLFTLLTGIAYPFAMTGACASSLSRPGQWQPGHPTGDAMSARS